jgi:hypothetical protein
MNSPERKKPKKAKPPNEIIDIEEFAKDMKPGEVRQIGDIHVGAVFLCDPPEPIKKRGKARRPKN